MNKRYSLPLRTWINYCDIGCPEATLSRLQTVSPIFVDWSNNCCFNHSQQFVPEAVRCRCPSWQGLQCKVYSRPWISVSADRTSSMKLYWRTSEMSEDVPISMFYCWKYGREKSVRNEFAGRTLHNWYPRSSTFCCMSFQYRCLLNLDSIQFVCL